MLRWTTTASLVVSLLGLGCSSAPAASDPGALASGATGSGASASSSEVTGREESSSPKSTATEPALADSASAEQAVLQLAIDVPELQPYFHIDTLPERKPLKMLAAADVLPKPPELKKFGEPVEYIKAPLDEAYLRLRKLHIEGLTAEVSLEYPIEGIVCKIWLTQKDAAFQVSQTDCLER